MSTASPPSEYLDRMATWREYLCSLQGMDSEIQPILTVIQRVCDGRPIDLGSTEWADALRQSQAGRQLAASINRGWDRWRHLFPDRPDMWRDILRNGWRDPKLDPKFDYTMGSATRPMGAVTFKDRLMGAELDKLAVLGVHESFQWSDLNTKYPYYVLKHAMIPKTGEDGRENGEFRMIVLGDYISQNEDVPKFRGKTDSDLALFLRRDQFLMRLDASKMFHQFGCRKHNRQLFLFYHPVTRELRQYVVLSMGIAGGSRVANLASQLIADKMAALHIPTFSYCDELLTQQETRTLSYIAHMILTATCVYLNVMVNFKKTDLAEPAKQRVFIGVQLDSELFRVAPSPGRLRIMRARADHILVAFQAGRPVSGTLLRELAGTARSMLRLHMVIGFKTLRLTMAICQHGRRFGVTKAAFRPAVRPELLQWIVNDLKYLSQAHPLHEWRHPSCEGQPPHTFVTDAAEWGAAGQGLTPEIQHVAPHMFYTKAEQEYHHNYQEGLMPLRYLDAVATDGCVPVRHNRDSPEVFLALLDNVTVVSLINKLRTRSLDLARLAAPHVIKWHQRQWLVRAQHIVKDVMDNQYQVDQRGRVYSAQWERGLPVHLYSEILVYLGQCLGMDLLRMRWVDLFTTYTVRRSNKYVTPTIETREPPPLWTDALNPHQQWNWSNPMIQPLWGLYLFPPERLLAQVLVRIQTQRSEFCLLVTRYTSNFPMHTISELRVSPLIFFGMSPSQLVPPEGFLHAPVMDGPPATYLAAILSGQPCRLGGTLQTSLRHAFGDDTPVVGQVGQTSTVLPGHAGVISSRARDYIRYGSKPTQLLDS